jgi:hypothetical protein
VLASTVEQRKMVLSQQMKLIVHNMCHITIGLGSFRFPDERRMISPSSLFIHFVSAYNSTPMHILISLDVVTNIQKVFSQNRCYEICDFIQKSLCIVGGVHTLMWTTEDTLPELWQRNNIWWTNSNLSS